ncbi:MAG: Response regulator MprA [Planctomycetota bacterium]|jgi:two-component system chemotaxis response regulator CheY
MVIEFPSLLITDDDRDFRETLGEVFERRGFRISLAGDGEEALQMLRREWFHVLLMDMHMPRLSGLETLRRIRELPKQPPCILISAAWDSELREAAMQESAFSVLPKPVSPTQLTGVVRDALRTVYNWDPKS